jgi:hypothetical protein
MIVLFALEFGPVDPLALIVALCALAISLLALVIAWQESRRNNRVILSVEQSYCSYPQKIDENDCKTFCEYHLAIQNRGISLFNVRATIDFRGEDGVWRSIGIDDNGSNDFAEFARGMVATFVLKSYRQNDTVIQMLQCLKDPGKQGAYISILAQNFRACRFRVGGWWNGIKDRWNRLAYIVNKLIWRRKWTDNDGRPVVTIHEFIPFCFNTAVAGGLIEFIKSLKLHSEQTS